MFEVAKMLCFPEFRGLLLRATVPEHEDAENSIASTQDVRAVAGVTHTKMTKISLCPSNKYLSSQLK
eukprot:3068465-Amphidinium_carterae.1